MSLTKTEICNMALYHLGISKEISNFDTESSEEAKTMRIFYQTALDLTLKAIPWPFAKKIAALGLVESSPNDEWGYSYRYPSDCLLIHKILSGIRTDSNDTRTRYTIANDDSGKLIYTDLENAVVEYTKNCDNTSLFDSDFVLALSYLLASFAVPKLTRGDQFKIKKDIMVMHKMALDKAKANHLNEDQPDIEPDSEFIRVRM